MKYPNLLDNFITYAKVNTRSDAESKSIPSTISQVNFAENLVTQLNNIGLSDVKYNNDNGFVTATVPSNIDKNVPTVGFIAHYDTADYNAENIQPQIHNNYDGKDILLNKEKNIVMKVSEFPNLKDYIGETLITTDGTTLLGSDDKSGIAEIVAAVEYLISNPDIKHGNVRIAFGPDEEIGTGADNFDVEDFNATFAYTLDSGRVGHMEWETFNAAQVELTFHGSIVHPGTAYNQMVNALSLAADFHALLPLDQRPENTRGYQGFYMLSQFSGNIDKVHTTYIIRDHDKEKFELRKQFFKEKVTQLNNLFSEDRISIDMYDQYYNMGDIIKRDLTPVELAKDAMNALGIEPIITPFRGGTDGSKITYLGLPTPNLFVGGENFHGQYEFVTLESMEKATDTILKIIELTTK